MKRFFAVLALVLTICFIAPSCSETQKEAEKTMVDFSQTPKKAQDAVDKAMDTANQRTEKALQEIKEKTNNAEESAEE